MNLVRNHFRDKKELETESLDNIGDMQYGATDARPDSELLQSLKAELDQLEDWERILLLLRSQDMPYADITKYTGKPAEQLKVYYARLKDKLSKKLIANPFKDELK
jgi:DNA-directed RNA polymerase specialized sigma24 family protein